MAQSISNVSYSLPYVTCELTLSHGMKLAAIWHK